MRYDMVGVIATSNCGAGCPVCGEGCKKDRGPQLSLDKMKKCADYAKDAKIPFFSFSGGEPTEHKDLIEAVAYAGSRGLTTSVATNASYAVTKRTALEYSGLLRGAGAHMIMISADADHEFGVPYQNWPNAIGAALEVGIIPNLKMVRRKSTQNRNREIMASLQSDLDCRDREEWPRYIKAGGKFLHVTYTQAERIGRAANLPASEFERKRLTKNDRCRAGDIVVAPYEKNGEVGGRLLPCCSFHSVGNQELYSLGDIDDTDIKTAIGRAKDSPAGKLSNFGAPAKLLSKMRKSVDPSVRRIANRPYGDFCGLCADVMKNTTSRQLIEELEERS
jgi:MoaA/NifB/PqqE/SkfB family radical SAM enzyme